MKRWLAIIICACVCIASMAQNKAPAARNADGTKIYSDSAIWQGMNIRLDLVNPVFELIRSKGCTWDVEMALNARLQQRYYPTLELGYAGNFPQQENGLKVGQGGFMRIGLDINPLKKHPERLSYMTVGVRAGTALQALTPRGVPELTRNLVTADAWGEVVAGVNVQIAAGFTMGWAIRMKWLFTANSHKDFPASFYIPGYGYTGPMRWGAEYYIGYKF